MNNREGRVVDIEDGFVVVHVVSGGAAPGRPCQRLAYVPQQVLPAATVGRIAAVPLADWELDERASLFCLPPLAALAGAWVWPLCGGLAAVGAIAGTVIGGLLIRWLAARTTPCTSAAQARTAPEPTAR